MFLILFLNTLVRAQPAYFSFNHLGVEQGLTQNTIYQLLQDSQGFLWAGTGDGLNRYDGTGFKTFRHEIDNPASLSNNVIRYLYESTDERLWITTEAGLDEMDLHTGFIKRMEVPRVKGKPIPTAKVLAVDNKRRLWLWINMQGILCYDPSAKTSQLFPVNKNIAVYNHFSWYDLNSQSLWLCTSDSLYQVGLNQGIVRSFQIPMSGSDISGQIYPYKDRYLLMLNNGGIQCFDRWKSDFTRELTIGTLRKNWEAKELIVDKNSGIWVATYGDGLYLLNKDGGLEFHYTADFDQGGQLNSNFLTTLLLDNNQNLWIGTDGGGINKLEGPKRKFGLISIRSGNSFNLNDNYIRSVLEDRNGLLWLGTLRGGINILDKKSGRITNLTTVTRPALCSNVINAIAEDASGNIWIGTDKGLCIYYRGQERIEEASIPGKEPAPVILRILPRRNGDMWIAIKNSGPAYAVPSKKSWTFHSLPELTGASITSFYEDGREHLWAIGNGNCFCISKENHLIQPNGFSVLAQIVRSHKCSSFCEDEKGQFWMSSSTGIVRFDTISHQFAYVDERNGLANDFVYNIMPDRLGNIWVASNKGLSKINIQSLHCRNYDLVDGLQSYEFNTNACYQSASGEFFWGGVNGLNYFFPSSIKDDDFIPALRLIKLEINDKELVPAEYITGKNELRLKHNQNDLVFDFACLDLSNPSRISYAYKVEGLDNRWHDLGNQHTVRLNSMQPGSYTLLVRATNADGVWNAGPLAYTIDVAPPYWANWWFRGAAGLLLLSATSSGVFWFSRQRYKRKLAEFARKQEIERIRNRISRDIHDEIGSGLTKIAIISERLKHNIHEESDNISKALLSLEIQSREMVGNLHEIVWTVNPQNDQLDSLIAYIRNYTADYLENAGIDFTFDFPESIPAIEINPDLRRNLFSVIKEAINNIVKYSGASEVNFCLRLLPGNQFCFCIRDNGMGFKETTKGNLGGNGLRNMTTRMEDLGGDCHIQSAPGGGVLIELQGVFR